MTCLEMIKDVQQGNSKLLFFFFFCACVCLLHSEKNIIYKSSNLRKIQVRTANEVLVHKEILFFFLSTWF